MLLKSPIRAIVLPFSCFLTFLSLCLAAQDSDYEAPSDPWGNPDLNGIWQAMGTAHWDLETHESRAGPLWQLGAIGAIPGGVGVVEGGEIPYRTEALQTKLENQASWLELDPVVKCYMPGIPRANYMPYPFQIFQTDQNIMFTYQFASSTRNVFMNRPDYEAQILTVMGHNLGRWEGQTLVIETTDQYDWTWFDHSGNYHSEALKVTERFTAFGPNTLWYEAEIDDPEIYIRPWKISMPLYRRLEHDARLVEFKCQEFSEDILYGHLRQTEEAAAALEEVRQLDQE
ncbi:MAG: hypothetical protein CMQ41_01475 [Gammaproteobacteria bacterium]|nr:hypothetical protein [Gammaproteobacteria bacterium]|tara:strand:+ start:1077 stop:1934 length:858 start_codon:yes stop_codon:yes gene_type:complete